MRTLNRTVYYPSRGDTFRLMHLTDLHIGAKACDEKLLEKHVRMIEDDPNMYWIGGGRLPGGHALTLGRILGDYFCDLALLGHRHVFQVVSKYQTVPGDRTARTRESIGVFMPSYLGQYLEPMPNGKPVDTYPELLALPATPLGAFPIVIRPSERKITLEYSSGVIGMIGKAA